MKDSKTIRCPGLPYPDYTELNKYQAEGWTVVKVRCDPDDYCVYFTLEKEVTRDEVLRGMLPL